jgi:hypothetical protein
LRRHKPRLSRRSRIQFTAARKLRAEGKRAECIGMLEKVALQLGVR